MQVKELFTVVDMELGNIASIKDTELPPLTITAEEVRTLRNKLLESVVDKIPGSAIRWDSMSDEEKIAWIDYRQALLDLPEQEGFPNNVVWPISPDEASSNIN